jgi:hypothetical protein
MFQNPASGKNTELSPNFVLLSRLIFGGLYMDILKSSVFARVLSVPQSSLTYGKILLFTLLICMSQKIVIFRHHQEFLQI